MREKLNTFIKAVLAGVCISIGGAVFLSVENKALGATLFTIGLFTICVFGLNLYTGKVCYCLENSLDYLLDVVIIWLGNLVGTFCSARLLLLTRVGANMKDIAAAICSVKLNDSMLSIFILAVFCNMLIYIGVEGYKTNPHEVGKYLALFFGVVVFILCGFEHCIANMFYFSVAKVWSLNTFVYLLIMTAGNAVGGLFFPVLRGLCRRKDDNA